MQDTFYREIILEHWKNPQNYGVLDQPGIDVTDVNPLCGDQIRITALVKDSKIVDIAFTAEGCAVAKASASVFTEKVKGKSLLEIQKITHMEVLDLLEVPLTPARTKCALLVYNVLNKALMK